jgi:3-oxoacyl-[acyl-carrier-protein] synthase-3
MSMSTPGIGAPGAGAPSIGIHAIGYALPESIRTNDWWPPETIERWTARRRRHATDPSAADTSGMSEGVRAAMAAIEELRPDPFLGVKQRRVVAEGQLSSSLEIQAAEKAIAAAGIDRSKIDLLLVHSMLPDDLNAPNACLLHRELGLKEQCFSMSTVTACNGFLMHLALAQRMIASGQARLALLVHSSVLTPLQDPRMPLSCTFGDGAAAAVVGPVGQGRGILGQDHRTNGEFYNVVRIGVPERRWHEDGRCYMFIDDGPTGHRMLLEIPDMGRVVLATSLEQAGLRPDDIDFFASHQGTAWFRRVSQQVAGLDRARSVDTFEWTGNLSSVNIPLMCALGEEQGLLGAGDLVAMYSGGSAVTWSGIVMRWGT